MIPSRLALVSAVTCFGLVGSALAQEEPPLLTLDLALQAAMAHAPSLRTAHAGVEHAEAQALEALMARLPTLTGRATIAPSGPVRGNAIESTSGTDIGAVSDIFDELTYQLNSQLRGTLPLYTFGKIELAEDLADVNLDVADMRLRKTRLELVFNVTRAYLGLQLAHALQDLIDDGTRRLRSAREQLEERLFEGEAGARTELRELTIQEANFTSQVVDNRLLTELSRRALEYLCGLEGPFRVEPLVGPPGELQLVGLEEVTGLAYENRPDLALLDRGIEAADLLEAIAWRQLVPDLFFAFGFSFNRNPLADNQPSPFANDPYNGGGLAFLLGLNWQLDFRQVARAEVAGAEAARTRSRQTEAIGGIELEIAQAYFEALGQEDRIVAYDDALRASRAWLRQRTLQFDSGLADYNDLSQPLLAYFASSASYHQALFEGRLARANLALKVGLEQLEEGRGLRNSGEETPSPGEIGAE